MKAQIAILTLLIGAGTAMAQNDQGNRPPPRGKEGFIKHFDKNNDGKVSKDEFTGPAEHFAKLDKNGDGYIDESEAPKGPPPRRGQGRQGMQQGPQKGGDFVKRLDKNGDGKVSKDEFDGPSEAFKHLDKNNDGYIDESEAPKGPPPREGGGQGGDGESQCPPPGGDRP